MADNDVILRLLDVTDESVVSVKTANGNFEFAPREIPYGGSVEKLDDAVEVERTGSTTPITSERTDDDFAAIAVDKDGVVYTAFLSFTPGLDRDERTKSLQEEPASLVETAIAAPIIYVALENILCRPKGRRWALAGASGLVHGFGYAAALETLGMPSEGLMRCLLAFNVGVEAG
jgi:hypothetical protein